MTHKTLILLRHGKSDWSTDAISDFERPLNPRGRKAAPAMAQWLQGQSIRPDMLLSSPARRAADTALLVCDILGHDPGDIVYDPAIYEASRQQLLDVIERHAGASSSILLVGHNPGLDDMVSFLAREDPPLTAGGKLMTTAAIAVLERRHDSWRFERADWHLRQIMRPKEL